MTRDVPLVARDVTASGCLVTSRSLRTLRTLRTLRIGIIDLVPCCHAHHLCARPLLPPPADIVAATASARCPSRRPVGTVYIGPWRARHDDAMSREDVPVDARFLLANERTLLAWIRTALTLMAGGVGVAQLDGHSGASTALGGVLLVLGGVAAAAGAMRYRAVDLAFRRDALPPQGRAPLALAGSVVLLAAVLAAAVLLH